MAKKSVAYEKSDAERESRTLRPTLSAEVGRFPDRLKEAIGSESVRAFAARAGISEAVLRSYLRSDSFPTLDRLDLIARAAERPPAWFISQESEAQSQSHAVSEEDLRIAIEMIDGEMAKAGKVLPLAARAEAIAIVYDLLVSPEELPSAKILQLVMRSVD